MKFKLLFCLFFIIISFVKFNAVFGQEKEKHDPFQSIGDRIKLLERSGDIAALPYPVIVHGIVWTQDMQLAVINEDIVQVGQQWRDFKVEKIEKDKVILSRGTNTFEIPLISKKEDEKKE